MGAVPGRGWARPAGEGAGRAEAWGALSGPCAAAGAACGAMSVGRRQVFIGKVLKRLFAATPSTSHVPVPSGEEMVLKNPTSKPQQKDSENTQASSNCASSAGGENEILLPRLYTVSLPPDSYVPGNPRTDSPTNAEHSESSGDAAGDVQGQSYQWCKWRRGKSQRLRTKLCLSGTALRLEHTGAPSIVLEDSCGQPKRKRIRRTKRKNSVGNPDNLHGEQTESGKHETLFQDNLQLQQTDGRKISKNKKRKMKKKRQKEKMRAAGLLTKTTGVDFTYQPEKDNSEGADFKDIYEKADGILDFLQATQEIYFADTKSKCTDSAMSSATVQEILQHLESHSMASSDVTLLHQMKSLVLLQDIERLKGILEQFQEHSMMLPGLRTK
ncbi:glutamate-rich protein 1 isoform X2 [Caretta caretta]|uniref:glutamate-rich protein 1 isoform X2 n=1 Tax=Caretta caretta TaxID=8467 RepID=UPI003F4BEE74